MTRKPRVLVVDDHEANRYAFEAVLQKDFDVVLADSGERALELCGREDFDVIVLDVRMPGRDGFDTAEALRARESTRVTPILFTSAYEQTIAQMTRGYVSGATDFLFSPVDPDLLRLKVGTYAQIHLRHEGLRRHVKDLDEEIRSLHAELARRGVSVTRVEARMRSLEESAQRLVRRALGVP
ncbi:MAG TPA: response regulator [Planctomycetota bacterium]|nr:response regulator [Planctomycetota bacterium]